MTENTSNHNPFSLSLGPNESGIEGVACAYLDFHPICNSCGMRLRKEDRIATAEMPLIRAPGHSSVPNYICKKCNIPTKYTNDMMLECLHEFHLKYPSSELLKRGIKGLTFVNRWRQNEDLV